MRSRQITLDYAERTDPEIPFLLRRRSSPFSRPPIIVDRARLVAMMAREPFARPRVLVPRIGELMLAEERRFRTRARIKIALFVAVLLGVVLAAIAAHRAGYDVKIRRQLQYFAQRSVTHPSRAAATRLHAGAFA
jgi:hypothetical protein